MRVTMIMLNRTLFENFNATLENVGPVDVILHMLHAKCIPALWYDPDACRVNSKPKRNDSIWLCSELMPNYIWHYLRE